MRRSPSIAIIATLAIGAAFVWDGSPVKAALPAPGGIDTGLVTWQKANDGTATNTVWQDSSGNGNTANGGGAGTLQSNSINFNPAYNLTGQWFNYSNALGIQGANEFTAFGIGHPTSGSSFDGPLNGNAHSGLSLVMTPTAVGMGSSGIASGGSCGVTSPAVSPAATPMLGTWFRTGTVNGSGVSVNGANLTMGTCNHQVTAAIRQLARRTQSGVNAGLLIGKIAERIQYNRTLGTAEQQQVQSYLAAKYGITMAAGENYIASNGSTNFWNAATNAAYYNNVTAIGRDDNSALNQKQSKSVNPQGIVTMGHGDIAADNVSNANNFASNLTFLAFGDDNNSATAWTDAGLPPALDANYKRLARTWKVQETGTVNNLTVSFDVNDADANIPAAIQDYYLINLTTGQAVPLTSSDGNNYAASGIDFANGDTFTIGTFDAQYNVHYRKTVSPVATSITPGQTFTYSVTAENLGNVPLTGLSFTDDLSDVIDDATYNNDVNATIGNATFNGPDEIEWNGNLAVGQTATVTYSFTMNNPNTGDGQLNNGVVGSGTGSNCTADPAVDPDCQTTTPLPVVTTQKTLLSPANPEAGDTANYQIIIENQGAGAAGTVSAADDLTDVLDDAVYNHDASATSGSLSYDPLTKRLSWNGSLAANGSAGDSVTINLSVTINAANSLGDAMLNNAVISPNCPNPAIFDTNNPSYEADCVTSTPVAAWTARKTTTGTAQPGATVSYNIQVENTGAVNLTGGNAPQITDDLSDVIDDATYNNDANAAVGNVSYLDPTLSWTGDLNIGQSATITYTAQVKAADSLANSSLANAIVGSMNCPGTAITNQNDPNFNADCAVVSSISTGSTPDPDAPSAPGEQAGGGGGLANTGQPIVTLVTGAALLIASALGVFRMRRGMIRK